jgi:transposase
MKAPERRAIAHALKEKGWSTRDIAQVTGAHHSTIAEDLAVGNPTKTVGNPTPRNAKEAEIRDSNEQLALVEPEPVIERYGTIVIDPPWEVEKIKRDANASESDANASARDAKGQVAYGAWGRWLTKHFESSGTQGRLYMQWARLQDDNGRGAAGTPASFRQMEGRTESDREERQSKQQKAFRNVLRDVAADTFVQERQTRDDEVRPTTVNSPRQSAAAR